MRPQCSVVSSPAWRSLKFSLGQFGFPVPMNWMAKLAEPKRFLFDCEWTELLRAVGPLRSRPWNLSARVWPILGRNDLSRVPRQNDARPVVSPPDDAGTPLTDAPTSWQYLLWKYEYDLIAQCCRGKDRKPSFLGPLQAKAAPSSGCSPAFRRKR